MSTPDAGALRALIADEIPQALIATDLGGRVILWNRAAEQLYGWSAAEALGSDIVELTAAVASREQAADLMARLSRGEAWSGEFLVRRRDGSSFPAIVTDAPLLGPDGSLMGIVGVSTDISAQKEAEEALRSLNAELERRVAERTADLREANQRLRHELAERRRAEEALRESEQRFRAIFNTTFQFIGLLDTAGTVIEANQTALDFGGLSHDDVVGRPFWEARWWTRSPATQARLREAIAVAAAGEFVRYEEQVLGAGDVVATIDFSLKPIRDPQGQVVMLIPEGRDISQRVAAEQALSATLEEKEVLLKEVHHRVKNNLQVVTSLLRLQARRLRDPEAAAGLRESQQRIEMMALAHQLLYRSSRLSHISAQDYIGSLVEQIRQLHYPLGSQVQFEVAVDPIELGLDLALPCGLLIHELCTNSLKHAFSGRAAGRVSVELCATGDGSLTLCVADDGVGIGGASAADDTLGMRLIRGLVRQLRGRLEIQGDGGTTVCIRLPAALADAPGG